MKIDLTPHKAKDMTDKTVDVISTSSVTADASPIVLNKTDMLRFRFVPILVSNEKEPYKSVSGKIVFEKKQKKDDLFPTDDNTNATDKVSRGSIKIGNWMELQLDTSETYALYTGLKQLYELYESMGEIPYGPATYARVDSSLKQFLSIIQDDPSAARLIGKEENYELVKILLRLITQTDSLESLKRSLSELQNDNLQHLSSSLNLEKLKRIEVLMRDNLENGDEEFWQSKVFKENQWVLSQIFACSCTIFADKAYVGGKSIANKGGNVCDFIYQNKLSQNIALIEIKTPCTEIIGSPYRGTYSFSHELSGAVNQVLNYRDKFTKEYYSLCKNGNDKFELLTPKCVVVIGKIATLTTEQIAAFENYRNSLNNIIIITFDELYERISDLIAILSDYNISVSRNKEEYDDDLPF